ncbi:MAG: YcxB family protein [Lachnospiraceae bacterium]|nr:YcxB family protein [Lachnospiraceae bacterium]
MKLEFDIKMTSKALYDYMLYHTYTGMQGIIGTISGLLLMALYFMGQSIIYLVAGLVVVSYLPISLFMRSKQQFLTNPSFKEPLHYSFDDEGMTVSQGENSETLEWEAMYKAVSTPGSIVLYTARYNASIFPKKDLGDQKALLVKMISTHMPPKKVNIRGN